MRSHFSPTGSPASRLPGDRSAIIYSIVVSCQRRGVDPLDYIRDVHFRLPKMTTRDDLIPLLPAAWKPVVS